MKNRQMMKKKKLSSEISETEIEKKALVQEKAGRYKEAIVLYKKLLQTSDLEKHHQHLADCYVQRAISFALKGMLKEAIVLWENHCEHVQAPYQAHDQYLVWLIHTNNTAKIETAFAQLTADQLDKQYPALVNVLGLLMLTEHPELQTLLPQESVLIEHFKVVQTALQSWQAGDQESAHSSLKALPYRSAFRDLRLLLNVIMLGENDIDKAVALLRKVPENSVYAPLATVLLTCFQTGNNLVEAMARCNHAQYQCIGEIKGFNKEQLNFLKQLIQLQEKPTDKGEFTLALKYKSLIGTELTQQFCQALLAAYPAGKKLFKKQFGDLDDFEENRVQALSYEQKNDIYESEFYWKSCIQILEGQETDNSLKIALIIRRMAAKESDEGERTLLLCESLDYDPSDHACYLHILRYYSRHETMAEDYKQWLAKSLAQFPEDVDILIQAVNAATKNKTFKKASQYALKILKIDPLNTFAKQTLFASHLAHARRLIKDKKYSLVDKELKLAEQVSIGKTAIQQISIMRGILCFAHQDKAQGLQLMVDALATHSDPVNMQFQAAINVLLTGLPLSTVLRELPSVKNCLLSREQLTQLFEQVKSLNAENIEQALLFKALEKIKAPLKKALIQLSTDETLLLTACQLFEDIQHFELLRHCAKLGFKQWKKPLWYYYKVYSETNNQPEKCDLEDELSLQHYHRLATEAEDYQTAMRLKAFLEQYHLTHSQGGRSFLEEMFGFIDDEDEEEESAPLDDLFGHLPASVQAKIEKNVGKVLQKMTPEQLAKEMCTDGNEAALIMAIIREPDLLVALTIIKIADNLGMNIEVSVDDVMERFNVNKKSRSFPFPF